MENLINIGERIRACRIARKLTQKELANLAGIAEITVRQYENNKRQPKVEQLNKLAYALATTIDYLMGTNDDLSPHTHCGRLKGLSFKQVEDKFLVYDYIDYLGYEVIQTDEEYHYVNINTDKPEFESKEDLETNGMMVIDSAKFILKRDDEEIIFTDEEFNEFEKNIISSVEFELYKQKQKNLEEVEQKEGE